MKVRSFSWGEATISWSVVVEELLYAAENMGHDVNFISTNGYKGMKYWTDKKGLNHETAQRAFLKNGGVYDIDLTYTVPQNFPQRFAPNSKTKMAIYAYESSIMPHSWKDFYHITDYVLPPSQYVANMMERNGCPKDKIVVVPHGVDLNVFNPQVSPMKINTNKKIKMLCIAEPHYRKQLDKLLNLYCKSFTSKDDICFVLKTKIFKPGDEIRGFEMDLKPKLLKLKKKYGSSMPEIKVISSRLDNIASLYTACDFFALMTASEGWGVPYLEALACGIPVIAPEHGGQLQFLNKKNSILTKCGTRKARNQEQYWKPHPKAIVGNPDEEAFSEAMQQVYSDLLKNKSSLKPTHTMLKDFPRKSKSIIQIDYDKMIAEGIATAQKLTWKNAMKQIMDLANV